METLSLIKDIRKLEEALGKESSDAIIGILKETNKLMLEQVAAKADIESLRADLHKAF